MAQASSGLQLQRSAVSFRRQGSSGVVWNDRFLSGELSRSDRTDPRFLSGELRRPNGGKSQRSNRDRTVQVIETSEVKIRPIRTVRSNDNRPHQDTAEPPSPRLSGCGCCAVLVKSPRASRNVRH